MVQIVEDSNFNSMHIRISVSVYVIYEFVVVAVAVLLSQRRLLLVYYSPSRYIDKKPEVLSWQMVIDFFDRLSFPRVSILSLTLFCFSYGTLGKCGFFSCLHFSLDSLHVFVFSFVHARCVPIFISLNLNFSTIKKAQSSIERIEKERKSKWIQKKAVYLLVI